MWVEASILWLSSRLGIQARTVKMKRFALSRGTGGVNSGIAVLDCKVSGISYEKFDGPKAVDLKISHLQKLLLPESFTTSF